MKDPIIVISGPSGGGKTTIFKYALENFPELSLSVSATNRSMREGEKEGEQYYFLTEEEFKKRVGNGEFLEYEEVYPGRFYGTLQSEIDRITKTNKIPLIEVEVKGALNIKNLFPDRAFLIFINPPTLEILEQRLRARKTETETDLQNRLTRAKYEIGEKDKFDVVIDNDKLDDTLEKIHQVISKTLSDK